MDVRKHFNDASKVISDTFYVDKIKCVETIENTYTDSTTGVRVPYVTDNSVWEAVGSVMRIGTPENTAINVGDYYQTNYRISLPYNADNVVSVGQIYIVESGANDKSLKKLRLKCESFTSAGLSGNMFIYCSAVAKGA